MYGLNPTRFGSQSGFQQTEWSPASGQTGLEESMWHLGLGSSQSSYPERPGVPDCAYYMRTGICGYGQSCRYNHPRNRAAVVAAVRATGDYPERPGEAACQFYLKTGACKFGASCRFHHPKHGGGSLNCVPLNSHGYPLRPGEEECSYYLKTGQCKFGITCKFHHPQQAGSSVPAPAPQFYPPVQSPTVPLPEQYGGAASSLRMARTPLLPGSYVPGAYGPVLISPGVVPVTGWNPYSAPVSSELSPGSQPAIRVTSLYDVAQLTSPSSPIKVTYPPGPSRSSEKDLIFPERPGEPECQYYMRNGNCKFGSSCRYHHPRERMLQSTNFILSPFGLPLRPGIQPCSFYMQNGHCKFGSTCKFDHPVATTMRYSPSASSLINVPVAPYPVGSLLGTLGPSSSSSELRPELIAATAAKDSYSVRVPSGSSSSSSVGLMFSHTVVPVVQSSNPGSVSLGSS